MGPYSSNCCGESNRKSPAFPELSIGKLCVVTLLAVFASRLAAAQDIKLNVTYICNGERIYVDSCNIRDLSDTATCMVEHPDHVNAGGIAAITSETRGSLKKRLPTCEQPSAKELAAHEAFVKKQQEIYAANVAKANPQPVARPVIGGGQSQQAARIPHRRMRRSGRCVGASLRGGWLRVAQATNCSERLAR